jgi:hypothetical protein
MTSPPSPCVALQPRLRGQSVLHVSCVGLPASVSPPSGIRGLEMLPTGGWQPAHGNGSGCGPGGDEQPTNQLSATTNHIAFRIRSGFSNRDADAKPAEAGAVDANF